ncbi:MAG: PKD domain-containing protein, partial [Thermoplasmata archaeon]|nr:PKD domain-containing protein [Thermoplasmata archaeon]
AALGSLAYDPIVTAWVYIGGCALTGCPEDQTWIFSHGGWRNVTDPHLAPPARYLASMVFDPNAGGELLFGGLGPGNVPLGDTWLYQGGRWTNLTYLSTPPSARWNANLAFDPDPGVSASLLFGGCTSNLVTSCLNDSWLWQPGAGWTPLGSAFAPPARGGAMMVYDRADGYLLLYGGTEACGSSTCYYQDTWEYYSGAWWPVHRIGPVPGAQEEGAMTYDAARGAALLFGGLNATAGTAVGETWSFAQGRWTQLTGGTAPAGRIGPALSPDSLGVPPLLVGGLSASFTFFNDTWTYDVPPTLALSTDRSSVEAGARLTFTASVSGGSSPFSIQVDYGDGSGAYAAGDGPSFNFSPSFAAPGAVTVRANVTDFLGETASASTPLRVTSGPSLSAAASVAAGDSGVPVRFTSLPGPNSSSLSGFDWTFGDGGSGLGENLTHTFSAPGSYVLSVHATDSVGVVASAELHFLVVAPPAFTISAAPSAPVAGAVVALTAALSGGVSPFQYAWVFGDGATSGLPAPSRAFTTAGTYAVQLWVNDSAGASSHASLAITVSPAPGQIGPHTTASGPSVIPTWYWYALAGIVGATVLGGILLARRR